MSNGVDITSEQFGRVDSPNSTLLNKLPTVEYPANCK
jgi:hypothetical protein